VIHSDHSRTLWINGRFLARSVTGVERVGFELLKALNEFRESDGTLRLNGAAYRLRLVAPKSDDGEQLRARCAALSIDLHVCGSTSGHQWEQFTLPRVTWGEPLLNLCNTAPVLKRKKTVFVHDAGVWAIPMAYGRGFRLWYRFLFRSYAAFGAGLTTNSQFSRSELARYLHCDPDRIRVILLGVDHVSNRHVSPAVLDGLPIPATPFVLAVSSANLNKNFAAVGEALRLLGPDAPICVVAGQRRDDIFQRGGVGSADENSGRVRFCGYVSDDQLIALMERALCLVYPSFYEGFGLPPLEAMSRGCPVIVSHTSAIPEICGNAAIYCDPADPGSIATAISKLGQDKSLQASAPALGRDRAVLFTWRESARRLVECLNEDARRW
jgi:glycosyltransferase involved in cell wall biosynthesis